MGKRFLVAGGAGFIGSHLCDALIDRGDDVVIIDNLVTGQEENVAHLIAKGVPLIKADISEPLPKLEGSFDGIFNLASPASPVDFPRIPVFILKTGAQGQEHLLQLAKEHDCPVLFGSTSEVYGDALEHPQKESYFGNVNPIGERSCYDEAKRFGEAITVAYRRQHKVKTRIVRIFNTYGPRMRPNDGRIIPNFFMQALKNEALTIYGEGQQTRSFCYVSDLVNGIIRLIESNEERPVNIGNPIERSVLDMANIINSITGNKTENKYLPLPEDDPKQRRPDNSRAKEVLNWEPQVSLEEGLEKTHEFFKSLL